MSVMTVDVGGSSWCRFGLRFADHAPDAAHVVYMNSVRLNLWGGLPRVFVVLAVVAVVVGGQLVPAYGAPAESDTAGVADSIVVTFDRKQQDPGGAAADVVAEVAERFGVEVDQVVPITPTSAAVRVDADLDESDQERLAGLVSGMPGVRVAEPDGVLRPDIVPDRSYRADWWVVLRNIASGTDFGVNAEDAWEVSSGEGVVVGVIDTGVVPHPDLSGSDTSIIGGNVVAGYDFISEDWRAGDGDGRDDDPTDAGNFTDVTDSSWHGTHVAGSLGALRNSFGVVGVAPEVKIQPLRVLGVNGGTTSDIAAAIRWGAGLPVVGIPKVNSTPAAVLSLSLGGDGKCPTVMQEAINAAYAQGVLVVASAGNDSRALSTKHPANCKNVASVVAVDKTGRRASFSNFGDASMPATLSAPGVAIYSTSNVGKTVAGKPTYLSKQGTSMAAPHVSGVAALLLAKDPSLTPSELVAVMVDTATSPVDCSTVQCGGVVNAARALGLVPGSVKAADEAAEKAAQEKAERLAAEKAAQEEAERLAAEQQRQLEISTVAAIPVPQMSGSVRVGLPVTAVVAAPDGASVTYQWLRSGSRIPGATGVVYALSAADAGRNVGFVATVVFGSQTRELVGPEVKVGLGSLVQLVPSKVSGTAKKGKKVKVVLGRWSAAPSKVTYQWLRSGKKIKKATKSSYKLAKADKGKKVSVRVTVSAAGYATAAFTSASVKVR